MPGQYLAERLCKLLPSLIWNKNREAGGLVCNLEQILPLEEELDKARAPGNCRRRGVEMVRLEPGLCHEPRALRLGLLLALRLWFVRQAYNGGQKDDAGRHRSHSEGVEF